MTKKELVLNVQNIIEHYRQDMVPAEENDGLHSICNACWDEEKKIIEKWLKKHIQNWEPELTK